MIFDELNTGFRWYAALNRQNRFKSQCAQQCEFGLLSTCNDLLPFQINTDEFGTPTTWNLKYLDGLVELPVVGPGINPPNFVWEVGLADPGNDINIWIFGLNVVIGTSNWDTDFNTTMTTLVNSINTGASLGSVFVAYPFDGATGITATWDYHGFIMGVEKGTLTFIFPPGTGASLNGHTLYFLDQGAFGLYLFGPTGSLPNYQIITGGTDESIIYELTDTYNISSCIEFINKHTAPDSTIYLTYNGESLPGCLTDPIPCGHWYSTIEDDGGNVLYSEVFEVVKIENANTIFSELDPYLFSALRIYTRKEDQSRYKSNCSNLCEFALISDNTALPPFQFRTEELIGIEVFKLVGIDEDCEVTLDASLIQRASYLGFHYGWYNGALITGLPCGKFYIVIQDADQTWYSEIIQIVNTAIQEDYLLTDDSEILTTDDGLGITID